MTDKKCQHPDGCEREHHCKNWCEMHYRRVRESEENDPGPLHSKKVLRGSHCQIDGCNEKHGALGYCMIHYYRSIHSRKLYQKYKLTESEIYAYETCQTCKICYITLVGGNAEMNSKVIDHDHNTGLPRGVLCRRCNTGLGQLDDDLFQFQKAIHYLQSELSLPVFTIDSLDNFGTCHCGRESLYKKGIDCRGCRKRKVCEYNPLNYIKNGDPNLWDVSRTVEFILEKQNNLCPISLQPLNYSSSIDHCHTTMKIRGMLSNKANWALGAFNDDVEIMMSAMDFLKNPPGLIPTYHVNPASVHIFRNSDSSM